MCRNVVHFESLRKEVDAVLARYNISKLSSRNLPVRNKKNKRGCTRKLGVDDFSDETVRLINEIYSKDFEYFGFEMIGERRRKL